MEFYVERGEPEMQGKCERVVRINGLKVAGLNLESIF